VEVTVRATELDELGMGIDFKNLKKAVNVIMEDLDHRDLNEHPAFQNKNPSSENIAAYIFETLKTSLTTDRYRPYSVTVCETENCCVTYREG
ncbi:MAG: 6-carboxytetrahydropterin synthase, partial [Proteobacteria bacterium]|nr:6-carboxytetrahydropterin synthase [Pseudomonadota bacterium]